MICGDNTYGAMSSGMLMLVPHPIQALNYDYSWQKQLLTRRHRFIHAKNADVLRAHRRPQQPVNEGTIEVQVIQSDMAGMTIKLLRLDTNGEFTSQKLYKCLELQRLLSYGSLHDRRREHRRRSELRLYNHVSLIGFYTTCVLRYNLHKMKSQLHNMTCICLHIS
ncbi:unnamed protein product [Peronospora belbahrii]|uniref:Uncharacterized protein n=1 Tax=Peronospora belbahrii TaxID=622444 RepID=A0AAU9L9K5_9STRA|nr:unnamed protein product [Peronospora belbahrii]CAH0479582.1 unnamed protein product [Peronospora belbahrii]